MAWRRIGSNRIECFDIHAIICINFDYFNKIYKFLSSHSVRNLCDLFYIYSICLPEMFVLVHMCRQINLYNQSIFHTVPNRMPSARLRVEQAAGQ